MWKSTYEAWSCQEDFYLRWFYTKSEVCIIIKRTILYARFRIIWRQVVYIVCLLVQVCTKFNLVCPSLNLRLDQNFKWTPWDSWYILLRHDDSRFNGCWYRGLWTFLKMIISMLITQITTLKDTNLVHELMT